MSLKYRDEGLRLFLRRSAAEPNRSSTAGQAKEDERVTEILRLLLRKQPRFVTRWSRSNVAGIMSFSLQLLARARLTENRSCS